MGYMKVADIPDDAFVRAVAAVNHDRGSTMAVIGFEGCEVPHILEHFPGVPEKVVRAKARKVLKRGYVTGCACGCRGDFEVTDAGRELLAV